MRTIKMSPVKSPEHCRFLTLHEDIGVEGGLSPISVKCSSNELQGSVGDI